MTPTHMSPREACLAVTVTSTGALRHDECRWTRNNRFIPPPVMMTLLHSDRRPSCRS